MLSKLESQYTRDGFKVRINAFLICNGEFGQRKKQNILKNVNFERIYLLVIDEIII